MSKEVTGKELSAKEFFETEKPFLNNFDPVENVATYGKLDMFEWADRFATARLEAVMAERDELKERLLKEQNAKLEYKGLAEGRKKKLTKAEKERDELKKDQLRIVERAILQTIHNIEEYLPVDTAMQAIITAKKQAQYLLSNPTEIEQ